jgi:hypothetical protein
MEDVTTQFAAAPHSAQAMFRGVLVRLGAHRRLYPCDIAVLDAMRVSKVRCGGHNCDGLICTDTLAIRARLLFLLLLFVFYCAFCLWKNTADGLI